MTRTETTSLAHSRQRHWGQLLVICLAQLMVVLDATIVNIALPSAQAELNMSTGDRQWVITAYTLAFGGLLLVGGRLAARIGLRRSFAAGLIGFAVASVAGGLAPTAGVLFAARAGQGICAALLAPAALALLSSTFTTPRERARAFGVSGAVAGSGAAVGLLAGGMLTEFLDWRWCLYVNVPIAAVALAGTVLLRRDTDRAVPVRADIAGPILSVAGLTALVFAFATAESSGWTAPRVTVLLVAGIALLAVFGGVESRHRAPMLPPRILRDRGRAASFLVLALTQLATMGFFLYITYYMQEILNYSPVQTGLAFLPITVAMVIGSAFIAAWLLPRLGQRLPIVGGVVTAAIGMGWMATIPVEPSGVFFTHLLPVQLLIGAGIGCCMMPAMSTATLGTTGTDAGVASAMVNATQQIGGSLGVALLNTVAATATAAYGGGITATVYGFRAGLTTSCVVLLATALLVVVVMPRKERAGHA